MKATTGVENWRAFGTSYVAYLSRDEALGNVTNDRMADGSPRDDNHGNRRQYKGLERRIPSAGIFLVVSLDVPGKDGAGAHGNADKSHKQCVTHFGRV